jgi:hypothetical protein
VVVWLSGVSVRVQTGNAAKPGSIFQTEDRGSEAGMPLLAAPGDAIIFPSHRQHILQGLFEVATAAFASLSSGVAKSDSAVTDAIGIGMAVPSSAKRPNEVTPRAIFGLEAAEQPSNATPPAVTSFLSRRRNRQQATAGSMPGPKPGTRACSC